MVQRPGASGWVPACPILSVCSSDSNTVCSCGAKRQPWQPAATRQDMFTCSELWQQCLRPPMWVVVLSSLCQYRHMRMLQASELSQDASLIASYFLCHSKGRHKAHTWCQKKGRHSMIVVLCSLLVEVEDSPQQCAACRLLASEPSAPVVCSS